MLIILSAPEALDAIVTAASVDQSLKTTTMRCRLQGRSDVSVKRTMTRVIRHEGCLVWIGRQTFAVST